MSFPTLGSESTQTRLEAGCNETSFTVIIRTASTGCADVTELICALSGSRSRWSGRETGCDGEGVYPAVAIGLRPEALCHRTRRIGCMAGSRGFEISVESIVAVKKGGAGTWLCVLIDTTMFCKWWIGITACSMMYQGYRQFEVFGRYLSR